MIKINSGSTVMRPSLTVLINPLHAKYTYMCMGVVKKRIRKKKKKDVP